MVAGLLVANSEANAVVLGYFGNQPKQTVGAQPLVWMFFYMKQTSHKDMVASKGVEQFQNQCSTSQARKNANKPGYQGNFTKMDFGDKSFGRWLP